MKKYIKGVWVCLLAVGISVFTGCAHQLNVKNLNMYRNTSLATLEKPMKIGIVAETSTMEGKRFVKAIADSLAKYNINATTAVMNNRSNLDVVATISIDSEYKGSGWNFLIDWPGFLIFTPAWHGYVYEIDHNFTVLLANGSSGKKIDSFNIPVNFDIRHAAINRTWVELGWLEFGIIPFVGGIFHISYDSNVTPVAHEKVSPVIADYMAQEIADRLRGIEMNSIQQ